MAYPTTAALVAASSVDALTSLTEEQQDSLRAAAIAVVQEYTQQRFEPVEKTVLLDGEGANILYLPERLAEFESISIKETAYPVEDVVLSDSRDRLHWKGTAGLGYYEQALAEVSGDHFPRGFGNIEITGTWGWEDEEFPEAVGVAIRWDMEEQAEADANALTPTIRAFRKLGLRDVGQGNLRVIAHGSVPPVSDRVANLLQPYVWAGQVGALA